MSLEPAYAGIDVACAKGKSLPIVVARWHKERLIPERLATLDFAPPVGQGNVAACDPEAVDAFTSRAREYLRCVETELDMQIVRIGIDAPSAPRKKGIHRRAAEVALDDAGVSCFTTPSGSDFKAIRRKVEDHLRDDGRESALPHANQLWMQVGFGLFEKLQGVAECVEVYPQATVRAIDAGVNHKSKSNVVQWQLRTAACYTGWPSGDDSEPGLQEIGYGKNHDRLDAYLSAWVAALDENDRAAYGTPPDDVIWVPCISKPKFGELKAQIPEISEISKQEQIKKCPGCGQEFKAFPLGWDAHAAYKCSALESGVPEARKREYKKRFGHHI